MSGQAVFENIVACVGSDVRARQLINRSDYEQWKRDYVWEALYGIRYGQSFCNHFDITDNHLYYAPGNIAWCDRYIKEHYIA